MNKSPQPIPPGQESLIPHLVCDRCAEAIEFYKKAFGAEEIHRMPAPDGRRIMHAALRIGSSYLFLVDDFPEFCGGKSSSPTALSPSSVNCDSARDSERSFLRPAKSLSPVSVSLVEARFSS